MAVAGDSVRSDEDVWRRVFRKDKRYLDQSGKPTARAFKPRPIDNGGLSVNVKSLTSYRESICDSDKYVLLELKVHAVNRLGLTCIHDPIKAADSQEANEAHALICNFPEDERDIQAIANRLAFMAVEVMAH